MENQITKLHNKALVSAGNYKKAQIELIDILMQLDAKRAYYQFDCNSLFEYCTKLLKLSESCSYKFIRIARTSKKVPELRRSLEKGEISTSKAVSLCSVLNPLSRANPINFNISKNSEGGDLVVRNQALPNTALQNPAVGERPVEDQVVGNRSVKEWLEIAKKSTNRELEAEIIVSRPRDFSLVESKRTLSQEISSLHLKLPKQIMEKLDRAQDLLTKHGTKEASYTEVLDQLLDFYLERKDPLKKVGKKTEPEKPYSKKTCKNTHYKRPHLKNECGKTELEKPCQEQACKNTKYKRPHLEKIWGESELEKSCSEKTCRNTKYERPLQKTSVQATSRQGIEKESPPKNIITTGTRIKIVSTKNRGRKAIPQKIKNQVFQKYISCCYKKADGSRCNQTRYLEIHHKTPVARGGGDNLDNLVLLCSPCHRLHHQKERAFVSSRLDSNKRDRMSKEKR